MSSINDALKRARQMKGTPNVVMPPPQELFIQKQRSKAPRILGGIIIISLAVAIVWYALGQKVITTGLLTSKKQAQLTPAKAAKVAPGPAKVTKPGPRPAKSMAASASPEKAGAKPVQTASAAQPAVTPPGPAPDPVKAKEAPAEQKALEEIRTQAESPAAKDIKPAQEEQKTAAPKPAIPAGEHAPAVKPSAAVQLKAEEAAQPVSEPRPETPVAAGQKAEAPRTEAASRAPANKPLEELRPGSSPEPEPRLRNLIADYRRAIELNPENTQAYLELGNIFFFEMNDLNQARRMYAKVLEIDPGHKLGHNNLGVTFLKQDAFKRAEAEFNAALRIDPSYADAQYNKACLSARMGNKNEAMARLLRAAQFDPAAARWAADDDDLRSLKGMPEFERFIRQPETANQKDE